jgi:hypothetical protein
MPISFATQTGGSAADRTYTVSARNGRLYDDDSETLQVPPSMDENLLKISVRKADPDVHYRTFKVAPRRRADRRHPEDPVRRLAGLADRVDPIRLAVQPQRADMYRRQSGEARSAVRRIRRTEGWFGGGPHVQRDRHGRTGARHGFRDAGTDPNGRVVAADHHT